jgi:5'-AMP-activated protein kinase catalytic alpha subunit
MSLLDDTSNYTYVSDISREENTVIIRAIDNQSQEDVAIKFPQGDDEQTAFEADILYRLDHESIIELRDVIPTDNGPAIVLPYAHGGDLFSVVANRGGLHESDARVVSYNLLSALAYCHDRGIWHRDVKLENIFLLTENVHDIVLADFGLAIDVPSWGFDGQFPGSRSFAAPEIWGNRSYTEKVDVWSTGVVLYAIVAGGFPYEIVKGVPAEQCIAEGIRNLSDHDCLAHMFPDV